MARPQGAVVKTGGNLLLVIFVRGHAQAGGTMFHFTMVTELHVALEGVYRLGGSLPDVPLTLFRAKSDGLLKSKEAECLPWLRSPISKQIY